MSHDPRFQTDKEEYDYFFRTKQNAVLTMPKPQPWWTSDAIYFCKSNGGWMKHNLCFGFEECNYTSDSEYIAMLKQENNEQDGWKFTKHDIVYPPPKPTLLIESKTTDTLDVVGDSLHAWYDWEKTPVVSSFMITWTVEDNNRCLDYIADWYNDSARFSCQFVELEKHCWEVSAEMDCQNCVDYPYDEATRWTPIELISDGPKRGVVGASFMNVVERNWASTLQVVMGEDECHFMIQLRRLYGTFGWFWLGGRITYERKHYFVLFCNEHVNEGGFKMFVHVDAVNFIRESQCQNPMSI